MNFTDYSKLFSRSINAGNPDKSKTLKGFQKRCNITRDAIDTLKEQHDKDIKELRETYTEKAVAEQRKPFDDSLQGMIQIAKDKCLADLQAVMDAKRKQLEATTGAPTTEQLRLLQTLSMRTSLSSAEINAVLPKLNDNTNALRVLADIAKKNNLPFPEDAGNVQKIEENLSKAEQFCKSMIDSLGKDVLSYTELCFWQYAEQRTVADSYFDAVDGSVFTAPPVRKQAEELSGDPNATKVYLCGDETLTLLSMQFNVNSEEIRKANPHYNFNDIEPGSSVIIPATHLLSVDVPGAVTADQCLPYHYEA